MYSRTWMEDAECANLDVRLFYPSAGSNSNRALKVCGACRVRMECLEYALSNKEPYGIWGGVTAERRAQLIQLHYGRSVYYSTVKEAQ